MSPELSREQVLSNARIVLEDRIIEGTVVIRDGLIADVSEGRSAVGDDLGGDTLIPGLVELHTDHMEGHYHPRPRVRWNPVAAVLAHDAQIATSGITTVCDALRIGMDHHADLKVDEMHILANAIEDSVAAGRLRADHYLHLRCEVSAADCADGFASFARNDRVKLASLMDHAPGQRQFVNIDAYAVYYKGKLKMSEEEFQRYCALRIAESEANSQRNRQAIVAMSRDRGIVLASHDDATLAHVDESLNYGLHIAEFPTTMEAARASHQGGLSVLMGAPNIIRGGSHSGNVSARDLAETGCLDILSSDYIPFSLIQSAFFLGDLVDGISLPQAVNMVARNPARAIGLDDRGTIAPGKRADLVRVRVDDHVPVVRCVWREGERVA